MSTATANNTPCAPDTTHADLLQCLDINCADCLTKRMHEAMRRRNMDRSVWHMHGGAFHNSDPVPQAPVQGFVVAKDMARLPVVKLSIGVEPKRRQLPNAGCINGLPVQHQLPTKPASSSRAKHLVDMARVARPEQDAVAKDVPTRSPSTGAWAEFARKFACFEQLSDARRQCPEPVKQRAAVPQSPLAKFCTNARDVTSQTVPHALDKYVL